jgi:polyhydroxybutyrate depolymerase
MRHILSLSLLTVLVLPLRAAAAAPTHENLDVGGQSRTYWLADPGGSAPRPTLILLHGLGGTGEATMHGTQLPMLGAQKGFVSVFPDGVAKRWNLFPTGAVPASYVQDWKQAGSAVPDDVAFLKALIAKLVERGVTDSKRVYVSGFSAGGFMAMRMVCEASDLFAGVALVSSSMPDPVGKVCHPPQAIPFYALKGTADDHEPYNGGRVLDGTFTVWSADQLVGFFKQLDGCSGNGAPLTVAGENPAKESFVRWTDCANGGPVILGTVQGGPHIVYPLPPFGPTLWWFFSPLHR